MDDQPFSTPSIDSSSAAFAPGFEARSSSLRDNRSNRAVSTGPKTFSRNLVLLLFFELARSPFAMNLGANIIELSVLVLNCDFA